MMGGRTFMAGVLAALAAATATAQTAIPYAAAAELSSEAAGTAPGVLHWHTAGDGAPFLSISDMSGGRAEIRDRSALRRASYVEIAPPAYSIAVGDGVAVSNGWFVLFDNRQDDAEIIRREVALTPEPRYRIVSVEIDNARGTAAEVSIEGDRAVIHASTRTPPPGMPQYTDCAFAITRVLAADATAAEERYDLANGDCLFSDALGDCSMGGIRPWTLRQLDGHRGDDWSDFRARSPVRLAGQPVVFDRLAQFRAETAVGTNSSETLRLYAGARPAVELEMGASTNSTALRIMGFEFDRQTRQVVIQSTAFGRDHAIVASASALTDSPMLWQRLETTSSAPATTLVDGVECYTLSATVPDGISARAFFRVSADIGEGTATTLAVRIPLVAAGGLVLVSPGGVSWRLVVDDAGNLSTVPDF